MSQWWSMRCASHSTMLVHAWGEWNIYFFFNVHIKFSCFLHSTCLCARVEWLIHACCAQTHTYSHPVSSPSRFSITTEGLHWPETDVVAWKPQLLHPEAFCHPVAHFPSHLVPVTISLHASVSLWEANLSAFPAMCLGNLFPGQPGYQIPSQRLLAGASFVYTFFPPIYLFLQGCGLVWADVDKEVEGREIYMLYDA